MKIFFVKVINKLIYKLKLYKILGNKNDKVVLLYHRVNKRSLIENYYLKGIFVSEENFFKQMRLLSNSERKNNIIITFDDGYYDNYQYAYPILKEFNLKGIFFITINFIEQIEYQWIDILNHYSKLNNLNLKEFKKLSLKIKKMNIKDRVNFLNNLNKDKLENDKAMNWKDLNDMKNTQIIANHTMNHPNFSQENYDNIFTELKLAKEKIENNLKIKDIYFAYPDGDIGSNQSETLNILKKLEYKYAFTTKRGVWDEKRDNSLLIKRIPIYYWDDVATFNNKLYGINIEDNLNYRSIIAKILNFIGLKEWIKKKLKF